MLIATAPPIDKTADGAAVDAELAKVGDHCRGIRVKARLLRSERVIDGRGGRGLAEARRIDRQDRLQMGSQPIEHGRVERHSVQEQEGISGPCLAI
ncbi:hypothetical protein [Flaviflexus equikiangi]|uniref:hypothetical protein n=1 Tax=Flaviflexus equikiangi TaxID=2758573 RepID=UPI0015F4641C|nr:hypothetical protein [Flaviflexus equikiangi]